ncbi:hypothetical protein HTV45_27935 [Streptomyces sp. CHD11]|uniref:NPCBM/NEW2 domain-containing protein n=1 Tax=Streptomyces sp. CHD11 TaxID=2741325 RepID=UPI001BFC74CA|nr:NPCBM/NEW2 domain-containing protein [Streptomyces sp. CHD11]MBT3154657.1 hypothetical protein [Streptomyces sp. CHD11]
MRTWRRAARGPVLACLLVCVATGCGDTNNIDAHAGRDGKVCVDGAVCDEDATEPGAPESSEASPSAGSPSSDDPSGDGTPDDDGGEVVTADPGSAVSGDDPAEARSDVRVRHLTEIGPIGGYGNNVRKDSSQLGDTPLTKSIVFAPGVFSKTVKPLTFTVPTGLTRFAATVGLDDETLPDYVAHVGIENRDGTTLTSLTLRTGDVHNISENVAGAGAITISVSILEWASDAVNSRPRVVIGDGRFIR